MNHLSAQRRAATIAKIRNKHIRAVCALVRQTSAFDRDVMEALARCTPHAQAVIRECCDLATDALADELTAYLVANGSNPFTPEPKPKTDTDA